MRNRDRVLRDFVHVGRSLDKRERVRYGGTWRKAFYYRKERRTPDEALALRFTPTRVKVRCCGKLHTITLTKRGTLVFHDHPNILADRMLAVLGGECRCVNLYEAWQTHKHTYDEEAKDIPISLRDAYRSLIVIHRARRNSIPKPDDDPMSCVGMVKNLEYRNLEVDLAYDTLLDKACQKLMIKALVEAGALRPGDKLREHCRIQLYNDLLLSKEERKVYNDRYPLHFRMGNSKYFPDQIEAYGRLPLSFFIRIFKQQAFIGGHLFLGRDESNKTNVFLKLRDQEDNDWHGAPAKIERGKVVWLAEE